MSKNTISAILKKLEQGVPTRQLVEDALQQLEAKQPTYNVAISVLRNQALKQADKIDADRKAGKKLGRLAGVRFIAKDNFLTIGGKTTAASNILKSFDAPYQATAIDKLEAEGAILIAKANLDAF